MTSKTKSEANASLLRIPKAKNKLGLKIPKIAMPHDDLISLEKPRLEIVTSHNGLGSTLSSQTRPSSQSSLTRQSSLTSLSNKPTEEVEPTKDYQKVPNSITKQAIPEGVFKDKDKHLYGVLYSINA